MRYRKLMKVFAVTLLIGFAVFPTQALGERILGDLDGNGVVNFVDFLTLAGNFGKTGDPYDPNAIANTYDTVTVYVQKLLPDISSDNNLIPDISALRITVAFPANWDSDAQNDGITFRLVADHSRGNAISLSDSEKAIQVLLEVSLFEISLFDKTVNELVFSETWSGPMGLFFSSDANRIPREKFGPIEGQAFNLSVKLITPEQGTFESIRDFFWN